MSRTAHAIAGTRVATNRQACHLMCAAEARVHPAGSFRPRATNPPIRRALIGSAFIVGFTLLLYGAPVPRLSEELYLPLVRGTVENVARLGPAKALTGPVSRGDASTLRLHGEALRALPSDLRKVHRLLALRSTSLALEAGTITPETAAILERLLGSLS